MKPIRVVRFDPQLAAFLPDTYALLTKANLVVHPRVSRIVLHGSRGLSGGFRPASDIDLSLIVDNVAGEMPEGLFAEITDITLHHWQAPVALDLAVIFDIQGCRLNCFEHTTWRENLCLIGGTDCFGLYKTQKGFNGLVTNAGIQVRLMYPCLKIWHSEKESG